MKAAPPWLHYPQVTVILTAMLFAWGIWALFTMPRREDPKITIRVGVVAAMYPGATSEQVEKQLTRVIDKMPEKELAKFLKEAPKAVRDKFKSLPWD